MATILNDAEKMKNVKTEKLQKDLQLCVKLEDAELWRSFHRMTNEMIVTKNGRYDHTFSKLSFTQNHSQIVTIDLRYSGLFYIVFKKALILGPLMHIKHNGSIRPCN